MPKRGTLDDDHRRAIMAGFTIADLERLNRLDHARNLRSIIISTKWLNDQSVELMRQYPLDFCHGTGMTVGQFLQALTVHIDRCHALFKRMDEPETPGC